MFIVFPLRGRGHLLVLLEHGLLFNRVPAKALAHGAQKGMQKEKVKQQQQQQQQLQQQQKQSQY